MRHRLIALGLGALLALAIAPAQAATPSFVQGVSNSNAGVNDYTLTFGANVTAGNWLALYLRVEHGAVISLVTFPGAQTPVLLDSCTVACGNSKDYYLYRVLSATGGGTDVSFHISVTTTVVYDAIEYANVGSEQAYATLTSLSTATTQVCPATTANLVNELAVSFFSIITAISMAPANGETERIDDTRNQIEEKLTAAAGSVANQVLLGSTSVAECAQVLFKGTPAPLPKVLGQASSAAAGTVLTAASFALGVVTTHCSTAALNTVVDQDPTAGTVMALGSAVNVQTSTGVACVNKPRAGILRSMRMRGL